MREFPPPNPPSALRLCLTILAAPFVLALCVVLVPVALLAARLRRVTPNHLRDDE